MYLSRRRGYRYLTAVTNTGGPHIARVRSKSTTKPELGASAMSSDTPTVRQRELGKRLRELRLQHGLTVEDVAEKLLCSATKISRLETGARRPSLRDVRDLCALYGVDEPTAAEFMNLARGAREQGWWTQYEDLELDALIVLEQDAT